MPQNAFQNLEIGCEFADGDHFFTLYDPHRRVVSYKPQVDSEALLDATVELSPDNCFLLRQSREQSQNELRVTQEITSINGGPLLDVVLRLVFPEEAFCRASIAGTTIQHQGDNIYYQHPTDELYLETKTGQRLQITAASTGSWKQVAYVRDEPGSWVIHIRLLPPKAYQYVVKLNTRWYNRSLPHWISQVLWKGFGTSLLYRGERKKRWSLIKKAWYWLTPLSAYPIGNLKANQTLTISANLTSDVS